MVNYPVDAELDSSSQYQSSGGTTVVSETADTAEIVQGSSDKRYNANIYPQVQTECLYVGVFAPLCVKKAPQLLQDFKIELAI